MGIRSLVVTLMRVTNERVGIVLYTEVDDQCDESAVDCRKYCRLQLR